MDGRALRRKLREVSVARGVGDEQEVDGVITPGEEKEEKGMGLDGKARVGEVEKDIRVTRLMVHPIKVSP